MVAIMNIKVKNILLSLSASLFLSFGLQAKEVDIVGIKFGMSEQEVAIVLKRAYPNAGITGSNYLFDGFEFPAGPAVRLYCIRAHSFNSRICAETIRVGFTILSQKVFFMDRTSSQSNVADAAFLDAVRNKYNVQLEITPPIFIDPLTGERRADTEFGFHSFDGRVNKSDSQSPCIGNTENGWKPTFDPSKCADQYISSFRREVDNGIITKYEMSLIDIKAGVEDQQRFNAEYNMQMEAAKRRALEGVLKPNL